MKAVLKTVRVGMEGLSGGEGGGLLLSSQSSCGFSINICICILDKYLYTLHSGVLFLFPFVVNNQSSLQCWLAVKVPTRTRCQL